MADIYVPNARLPREFRRIDLQTDEHDSEYVRKRYRFSPEGIDRLEEMIGHHLTRQTRRNQPLTSRQQILIALRFYASGSFLQVIGDTFGIDVATVSRVITDVTDRLFDLKDRVIVFPLTEIIKQNEKENFFQMYSFPGVIGLIDCTHVAIRNPGKDVEHHYVNRKHYHSINVQATCNHQGKFTSINACWPGSCHDAHILRVSNIGRYLERNNRDLEHGVILGDSGYPCRPFLLTPYQHTATEQEERYNRSHCATRNLIERTFGVWKRRFHILGGEIRMKPCKSSRIIVACAVLHNLAIEWQMGEDFEDGDVIQGPPNPQRMGPNDGQGVRAYVATTFF